MCLWCTPIFYSRTITFSIFINYMILCSPKNKYILFVDDTNIIITYKLLNNLTIINYNQHVMTFFYGINLINYL